MFFAKTALALSLLGGFLGLALGQQPDDYRRALQAPGSGFNTVSHVTRFYTGSANNWRKQGVQVQNARTGKIYPKSDRQYRRLKAGDIVIINKSLVDTRDFRSYGYSPATLCEDSGIRWCAERLSAFNNNVGINAALPETVKVPVWIDLKAPNPPPAAPAVTGTAPSAPPAKTEPKPGWTLYKYLLLILLVLLLVAALLAIAYRSKLRGRMPLAMLWLDRYRFGRRLQRSGPLWKWSVYYRLRGLLDSSGISYRLRRSPYGLLVQYSPEDRNTVREALEKMSVDFPEVPLSMRDRGLEEVEVRKPPGGTILNPP